MDTKGKAIRENVELAFDRYCEYGGNVSAALRSLESDGLSLTRTTFDRWSEEFRFEVRRIELDHQRQSQAERARNITGDLLDTAIDVTRRYADYFNALPQGQVDNQAVYALKTSVELVHLLKNSLGIKDSSQAQAMTPEERAASISRAVEDYYGIKVSTAESSGAVEETAE